jgi:hypothetical protein
MVAIWDYPAGKHVAGHDCEHSEMREVLCTIFLVYDPYGFLYGLDYFASMA